MATIGIIRHDSTPAPHADPTASDTARSHGEKYEDAKIEGDSIVRRRRREPAAVTTEVAVTTDATTETKAAAKAAS